ncbi:hypothetical protein BsWGS_26057 [Bradybaena similaris]
MAETGAGSPPGRCRGPANNSANIIKRQGEMSGGLKSSELMNTESSDLCGLPKELLLSNGRSTPKFKSQVRILHREAKCTSSISENLVKDSRKVTNQGPSKHSKSLQQRETEYAEARRRIFGCLPPEGDENTGSKPDGHLAEVTGCGRQPQSTPGVVKPASSTPSPATSHPKGTLLRRPTNGANHIATQLEPS